MDHPRLGSFGQIRKMPKIARTTDRERNRKRRKPRVIAVGLMGLCFTFGIVDEAGAHAPDEYGHNTYLTVVSTGVQVEMHLTPGPLVASKLVAMIDDNQNGTLSDKEIQHYGQRIAKDLSLSVDSVARPVVLVSMVVPPVLEVTGGGSELIFTGIGAGSAVSKEFRFVDKHRILKGRAQASILDTGSLPPDLAIDHAIDRGLSVTGTFALAGQASRSASLGSAEETVLGSSGTTKTSTSGARESPAVKPTKRLQRLLGGATTPGAMMGALAIAALLGALHALTPGHGKTIAAAYLIGERATVRDAFVLGGSVTITHTASVLLLGAITIGLADRIDAAVLAQWLRWGSGSLVFGIGIVLLLRRWRGANGHHHSSDHRQTPSDLQGTHSHDLVNSADEALRNSHGHSNGHPQGHEGGHPHDHSQGHSHDHVRGHSHGHAHGHMHGQAPTKEARAGIKRLVALGASGGLVPCPEALGVLIVAVAIARHWEWR